MYQGVTNLNIKILVVDDEPDICRLLKTVLEEENHFVETCASPEEAITALKSQTDNYDLVIADINYPGTDLNGIDIVKTTRSFNHTAEFIMITGDATLDTAVEALRAGAFDYIRKPLKLDELLIRVKHISEKKYLTHRNIDLQHEVEKKYSFDGNIIGKSKGINDIYKIIEKVASSNTTVIIYGESGTGKELVAKAIHYNSPRRNNEFVAINSSGIPENLLESELFGHEKGSFTGAVSTKMGLFEVANKGTLFLDEIGDLSLNMQAKLLREIQEREIKRVGGTKTIPIDVRILAATNKDLQEEIKKGRFREDLYYRLNVVPITLPPLRDRKEDIPLIIDNYLKKKFPSSELSVRNIPAEIMDLCMSYDWPGNIRELESTIEHAVILGDTGHFNFDNMPIKSIKTQIAGKFTSYGDGDNATLDEIEKQHIERTMKSVNGSKSKAAKILQINRSTLYRLIQKYGL